MSMSTSEHDDDFDQRFSRFFEKIVYKALDRHEKRRAKYLKQAVAYSPAEFAAQEGLDVNQVRFWLREGQIIGTRLADTCSGKHPEWRISHAERGRYQAEGLYPRYSVESFAKELLKIRRNKNLDELRELVEGWIASGQIKATKCPHGMRISSDEMRPFKKDGFWPPEAA